MKLIPRRIVLRDLRQFVQGQPTSRAAAKKLKITPSQLSQVLNNPDKAFPAKVLKKLGYVQVVAYTTPADAKAEAVAAKADRKVVKTITPKKAAKKAAKRVAKKSTRKVAKKTAPLPAATKRVVKKAPAKRKIARSARTGKIVSKETAKANPDTTVVETIDQAAPPAAAAPAAAAPAAAPIDVFGDN